MTDVNEIAPSFGSFNIQDTQEMAGNQQLLTDLLGPDTASASPDDIEKIEKKTTVTNSTTKKPVEKKEEVKTKTLEEDLLGEEGEEEPVEKKEEGEETEVNTFEALSKDLFKLGIFSKEEGEEDIEIKDEVDFAERFKYEKLKGANQAIEQFIGRFGEDYQDAFKAIYQNGVSPQDYFGTLNKIENYAEMDMTVEANQVAVVKQALTEQGLEPEDVTSEIEKIKQYGDLEEKSQKFHKVLIKKEAAKLEQLEKDSENKLRQQSAVKQQYVTNVNTVLQNKLKTKEFDGIPINPKLAGELQDFLITERYKTPSGETLTEFDRVILDLKRPENHEKKVKVGLLLKMLETDPTLSSIQKTGITKKVDALFGEVARQAGKGTVKSDKAPAKSSWNL